MKPPSLLPLLGALAAALAFSPLARALTYRGADISSLIITERQGRTYSDTNGKVTPFERIMTAHNANTARVRVWTAGDYTTTYALSMAKRIKGAGMTLIVDLHLSDTWADPGKQAIPSAWPKNLAGLNTQIYNYTLNLVQQFANQGTPIDILQVGNEINNGLLWPVGEISVNGIHPVSELLHSSISGARDGGFGGKTLIHLANGWNWSGLNSFFSTVFVQGALASTDVDIIGVSFYPFYDAGATLSALKSSLTNLANTYKKPIVVAETDWPVSCSGVRLTEPSIPVSAAGQETWTKDIRDTLAALPNGLGQGILYWEPSWVGSANLGSSCADNLIVNSNGSARSSINIFNDM